MSKFSNIALTYQEFETVYKRKIIDLLTDKRMVCNDKDFHIFFTDIVKFVFSLNHGKFENLSYTEIQATSDFNKTKEFIYSKERDELISYEVNNNHNVQAQEAQDIILFPENLAELIICS